MGTETLKFHPICLRFPAMTDAEFDALVEDIRANGLEEDIVMFEGMILDGRHRHGGCLLAGVAPRFTEFKGTRAQAIRFSTSKNVKRRHLTESQRAALAAEEAVALEAEDATTDAKNHEIPEKKTSTPRGTEVPDAPKKPAHRPRKSRNEDAAKDNNVSVRSTQRARNVLAADPELHEQVKAGEITVKEAEKKINPPPDPVDPIEAKRAALVAAAESLERPYRELCDLDRDVDRPGGIELLGKFIAKVRGKKRRLTPKPVDEIDQQTEELWKAYPRKVNKGDAVKAIAKALQKAKFHDLLASVKEYAAAVARWPKADQQYIPHASRWFNGNRWEDDRDDWKSKSATKSKNAIGPGQTYDPHAAEKDPDHGKF